MFCTWADKMNNKSVVTNNRRKLLFICFNKSFQAVAPFYFNVLFFLENSWKIATMSTILVIIFWNFTVFQCMSDLTSKTKLNI